ncbi:MAG: glycoside hydrolase family 5 protein [Paracoccaceae bacterium]
MQIYRLVLLASLLGLLGMEMAQGQDRLRLTGVNLAGADFGEGHLPGIFGKHYTYPVSQEMDYFTAKGMNVFRLPFRWERLQRQLGGPLDSTELARIKAFVSYASQKQAQVILDPHNYARYQGQIIGDKVPVAAFADFWSRLAQEFSGNRRVIFGLMNEPHNMPSELWLTGANAAIAAIRKTGAKNIILVPGNGWSGAHSWSENYYGTPNSVVMAGVRDPLENYAFDVHQYLDRDFSGHSASCVSRKVGADRLRRITAWMREQGTRAFLSEFGAGKNARCLEALDNMLNYMDENEDIWLGWTYWAAGPWWGDYIYTLEPKDGVDRAQMAVLQRHMAR